MAPPIWLDDGEADNLNKRKANATLIAGCDGIRNLKVTMNDGTVYHPDIQIESPKDPLVFLRGEHKAGTDLIRSHMEGGLARQLSYVDFLIVEWDTLDMLMNIPSSWEQSRVQGFTKSMEYARKHLTTLSMNIPVIITDDQDDTVLRLRHLEKKLVDGLQVRENNVRIVGETGRTRMLSALKRVNPHRITKDGRPVHQYMDEEIKPDWKGVLDALRLSEWPKHKIGLGPGTVADIVDDIMHPKPNTPVDGSGVTFTQREALRSRPSGQE